MAESILFDLSAKILEKLGSDLLQDIGSLFRVKDELARLKRTVSGIKPKLLDAEERSNQDRLVEHWLKELKDVLYDVDDLLDAYSTKILQRNAMSGNRMTKELRAFFSNSAYRVEMSRKIRSVKEKLDDIAKGMNSFNFRDQNSESRVENFQRRETHSFVDESASDIIGREHDKEEVIKLLSVVNLYESVSTVAIVGFGGLGKTTLAQLAFNDKDFSADFELKFWVHVSEIFDVKTILQKISCSGSSEMEKLQQEVRKKIDGKKYLLVLDDLWEDNHGKWMELKILLAGGARGSRILVTTRSANVAWNIRSFRSYELKGLNEDDSWSLFNKKVIGPNNVSEVSKFQDLGREIVKKCDGVPLTIKTIGGVLYDKTADSDQWLRVKNGFANVNSSIREDLKILKLSYDHLPSPLKHCFAYCSLFPKGYDFNKKTVIQLWIAQGFVQASWDGQHLEDAGDEYFSELLGRSFFQEARKDDFGNITTFKMHDLMCDLARFVAGTECSMSEIVDEKTRHVSLNSIDRPSGSSSVLFPNGLLEAKKTRTLIFPNQGYFGGSYSDLDTIFSTFRCLRALDLNGFEFESLPDSIGKLKHLRYLDISSNHLIKKLPRCMEKLQNLQTLKLSNCTNLLELPSEITKIASLRHIEIDRCNFLHMPHGLGQLTSLRTLSSFVVGKSQSSASRPILNMLGFGNSRQGAGFCELNKLNNLRGKLTIVVQQNAATALNTAYLKEKQYLQSLSLFCFDGGMLEAVHPHPNLKEVDIFMYGGLKIPNWISSLRNLVSIRLRHCYISQHIPKLYHLLSLKELTLEVLIDLEYISSEVSDSMATFFPSLEKLSLTDCENLRGWWRSIDVEIPQFQRLSRLEIVNCPNLTSMPLFPFLEYLKLENASPKPLQETVTMLKKNMAAAPSKMSSFHVSRVEDIKSQLDQWLQCFPSIRNLAISDCPGVTLMPPHLKHLCSLKNLKIRDVKDLDPSRDNNGEDFQWQHLTSLSDLTLSELPKMVVLPSALQHVTTLQYLRISSCPTLKALPEWLPNLNALHYLLLRDCPKLKSMPDGMPHLASLRDLYVYNCGELSKRCRRNEGEDWPKIAHVRDISVDEDPYFNSYC